MKNTVAVVTGANKGIGKALTELLLSNGVKVAAWCRTAPAIQHDNLLFCKTDVRDKAAVKDAYAKTISTFGKIDTLINNAGLGFFGKVDELPDEQWEEMIAVNVNGMFYCTKAVVHGMKEQKSGCVVNISSAVGLMGIPEGSGYCATKFGVRGFSEALYKELRPYNIKVCCVYPGSTNTNFFDNQPGSSGHPDMMSAGEVAAGIMYMLQTPGNVLPSELVLRPMNVKL